MCSGGSTKQLFVDSQQYTAPHHIKSEAGKASIHKGNMYRAVQWMGLNLPDLTFCIMPILSPVLCVSSFCSYW